MQKSVQESLIQVVVICVLSSTVQDQRQIATVSNILYHASEHPSQHLVGHGPWESTGFRSIVQLPSTAVTTVWHLFTRLKRIWAVSLSTHILVVDMLASRHQMHNTNWHIAKVETVWKKTDKSVAQLKGKCFLTVDTVTSHPLNYSCKFGEATGVFCTMLKSKVYSILITELCLLLEWWAFEVMYQRLSVPHFF